MNKREFDEILNASQEELMEKPKEELAKMVENLAQELSLANYASNRLARPEDF